MREIPITSIERLKVGNAQDPARGTGCTVLLCEEGAPAGLDVRGGGPASRESQLLRPTAAAEEIHAVLLSGGSAFGLGAANGVMRWLAEHDFGLDTGVAKVPLVCQSCIFDLGVGDKTAFPDADMAYAACVDAQKNDPREGNRGAGCGATVGKLGGASTAMKSGLGIYAARLGELQVGAVVAVNALGDVFDTETGKRIAGMLTPDGGGFADSERMLFRDASGKDNFFTGSVANTTIACVVTNARFDKAHLTKVAAMAQNGLARAIWPVHTTADGDSVYALSVGRADADINAVGTLAARVLERAIARAVRCADSAYGLPAARDLPF